MIGQQELMKYISRLISDGRFPRFALFIGEQGSEKSQIAEVIASQMHANYASVSDCKVDTIRQLIDDAYRVRTLTVFNISDADNMSLQAKNAMLKVMEEPPNRAYFVMTLEDTNNTLPTILSRATVYNLNPYSADELRQYAQSKDCDEDEVEILLSICETPGDIDLMLEYEPKKFYSFIEKVVDHVATASGSNVFKIGQSLKFKESDESGYDLRIFWKAFTCVCVSRKYYYGVKLTSTYSAMLRSKSVNRLMLFDNWILDIREEWAIDGCC